MPTPDFSLFTPQGGGGTNGPGAATDVAAANALSQGNDIRQGAAWEQGKMNQTYTRETMPQLQSGIASSGQWYGSDRKTAVDNATRHFTDAQGDINLSANRQLNDLTRQQSAVAVGLII